MVSEHRQKERISDGAMAWGQIERVEILRNRSHCLRQNSWTVTRSANRSTRRLPPVEMRRSAARIGTGFADTTRELNLYGTRTRSKILDDERHETDDPADARADRHAPCRFGT